MALPTLLDVMKRNAGDAAVGLIDETTKLTPEVRMGAARTIKGLSFRGANEGVVASKSQYENRTVGTFILNPRWNCDKAVADANEDGALAYIYEEAEAIIQAAFQALGTQFYYGAEYGGQAKGHPGLRDFVASAMIADAGGTAASTGSSVWAVKFGRKDVRWVVGNNGEVKMADPWIESLTDADGNQYTGYVQELLSRVGLQMGSIYSIGCIKNLTADSGKGLTDDLVFELLSMFKMPPDVIFASGRSIEQLRKSRTATNATGAPAPTPTEVGGVPLAKSESILDTETLW
jgi:hypothetical protein